LPFLKRGTAAAGESGGRGEKRSSGRWKKLGLGGGVELGLAGKELDRKRKTVAKEVIFNGGTLEGGGAKKGRGTVGDIGWETSLWQKIHKPGTRVQARLRSVGGRE